MLLRSQSKSCLYCLTDCFLPCAAYLHFNRKLQKVDPKHQLLVDVAEKSDLFDRAAAKYKSSVAA